MLAHATALRSAPLAAGSRAGALSHQTQLLHAALPPKTVLPGTRLPPYPTAPAAASLRSATKARGAFRDFVLGPDVSVGLDGAGWRACSIASPAFCNPAACRGPPAQTPTSQRCDCAHCTQPEERLKDAEVKEHFWRLRAVGWTLLSAAAAAANAAAAGSFWYEYVSTAALAVIFMTASELFNLLGLSLRLALIKYLMSQQP